MRGCASLHPHVLDDFVIHEVVGADVCEFIRCDGTKKCIVLCGLRQECLEFVAMYETQRQCINGMK